MKILFCAEDYGGVKSLFPIYLYLKKSHACKFFVKKKFTCEITNIKITPTCKDQLISGIKNFSPNVIFLGTSSGKKSIDKVALNFCQDKKIKKIIVFDEWYDYKKRLIYRNKILLADIFIVNNKEALKIAVKEGLRSTKIMPICQFHLSNLFYNYKKKLKTKNQILFLSEKIIKKEKKSIENPGYTSMEALDDLIAIHKYYKLDSKILIKKHPSEINKNIKIRKFSHNKYISYIYDYNIIKYLVASKFVVGMRSMAILESLVLKRNVISYQPNSHFERCSAVKLKLIKSISNKESLKKIFRNGKKNKVILKNLNFLKKIEKINFKNILKSN